MIDKEDNTIFVKLTGKFPLRSVKVYTLIFILYDWTINATLETLIKDVKYCTMFDAFKNNIEYLLARGFKPEYNVIDNVASKAIQTYLTKEKIQFQLFKPHNHCANVSKLHPKFQKLFYLWLMHW